MPRAEDRYLRPLPPGLSDDDAIEQGWTKRGNLWVPPEDYLSYREQVAKDMLEHWERYAPTVNCEGKYISTTEGRWYFAFTGDDLLDAGPPRYRTDPQTRQILTEAGLEIRMPA